MADTRSKAERHMDIVTALSEQILEEMKALASEESHPSNGPDESDDFITDCRKRILGLRFLRHHFEDVMTGTEVATPFTDQRYGPDYVQRSDGSWAYKSPTPT